jgi:hypothetical protein
MTGTLEAAADVAAVSSILKEGRIVKPFNSIVSALMLVVVLQPAHAQVTLDVAKITCDQFLLFKVADPRDISLWLSGYYSGQSKNTVLDPQGLKDHFDKVKDYCRSNLNLPVIEATKRVLEMKK